MASFAREKATKFSRNGMSNSSQRQRHDFHRGRYCTSFAPCGIGLTLPTNHLTFLVEPSILSSTSWWKQHTIPYGPRLLSCRVFRTGIGLITEMIQSSKNQNSCVSSFQYNYQQNKYDDENQDDCQLLIVPTFSCNIPKTLFCPVECALMPINVFLYFVQHVYVIL